MNRYRAISFAILFTLLLGCTPVEVTPTTPATAAAPVQVTRQTPTATAPSSMLTPTATQPLPTATSTPAATATVRPSLTPRPSATPTPAATTSTTYDDLPGWLSDPQAVVLMARTAPTDPLDDFVITFSNLTTGERFDIPVLGEQSPGMIGGSWYQDETGTYFVPGRYAVFDGGADPPIEQVNIATGEVRVLPTPEGAINTSRPGPGGRYAVRITDDPTPKTVVMEDRESGQSVVLPDPFDGRYANHVEIAWAPAGDFLAVLRYAFGSMPNTPPATGLIIYRTDGTIFRWYDGFYGNTWAPDNSYRILYQTGEDFGIYQPCVLDVLAGTSECLAEVMTWHDSQGLKTDFYQWLPSGQAISFVAWNEESSLCIVTLANRQIACPIDSRVIASAGLAESAAIGIVDYQWSPDGRYLWLTLIPGNPESHDWGNAQIAIAAADGSQFQVLGFGNKGYWRPDLNP